MQLSLTLLGVDIQKSRTRCSKMIPSIRATKKIKKKIFYLGVDMYLSKADA